MRFAPPSLRLALVALLGAAALAACAPPPDDGSSSTTTTAPASTAIGGDYAVRYATTASAAIRVSGDTLTVTAGHGLRTEGATCTLPDNTVLAVLTGSGDHYSGTHWSFNSTTCASVAGYSSTADRNTDGSVTLTGPTGTHLFTKTGDVPSLSPDLAARYEVTYGTSGGATAHLSGDVLTLSVSSPFRTEGSDCDLPDGRVLGIYNGTGLRRSGSHWSFNASTCSPVAAYSSTVYVNSDRSLTVTGPTGPHLFVRKSSVPTQSPVDPVGSYGVRYGSAGTAVLQRSGSNYTLAVGTPFSVEGSSCSLGSSTVLGTYSGTTSTLGGSHWSFNASTCSPVAAYSSTVYVNSDRSLTVTAPSGPHVFERL